MENCKIESSFCVANQIVHVEAKGNNGKFLFMLPIKFAPYLEKGNRLDIFKSKETGKHIAYRFKNQLLFATPILNQKDAKMLLKSIAGVRDFSMDKCFFIYSILMAMQSNGIKPSFSMLKNILALKLENQI